MSDPSLITDDHLRRLAFVYIRQSTPAQVVHNRESRELQYHLVDHAAHLGWPRDRIQVVDEDLAVSGTGLVDRDGFERMTAQVALGRVGLVISREVQRVARNNADWYRLLDLCVVTDTLIADVDGIYHPARHNDRLVLGLKGTISEAELHTLRVRLQDGIRNKAARGELRRGLPIGLVWGEGEGQVLLHPDEAVTGAIRAVFERFAEMGSARRVWLWFRSEGVLFPLPRNDGEIQWVTPTYTKVHAVLTNPVYAGAYVYGKSRQERYVDDAGKVRNRTRRLPPADWSVFLPGHHAGYLDWETFKANQARLAANTHPRPHEPGGAVREGAALLQGIAACGRCGRKLRVYYSGRNSTPGYYCPTSNPVNGRGEGCLRVGGRLIDDAVASAFLATVAPAGIEAAIEAIDAIEVDHDTALDQWRLQVERLRFEAQRAERRYRAVDPDNRLVARGLEAEWEAGLRSLEAAEAELSRRESERPRRLRPEERARILALGSDLERVWSAEPVTDRDRKELLNTLLEEVIVRVDREKLLADLTLRWRGGLISDVRLELIRRHPAPNRTDEETVDLVRRLSGHYPDAIVASILNRQGRRTATGLPFNLNRVCSLRAHWGIPTFVPAPETSLRPLLSVREAAAELGVAPSTLHRGLNDGFIPGEQLTPSAPWRIRMTDELRAFFVEEPPAGYVPLVDAMRILGVSKQAVLQKVKRGELTAVHVSRGRRKGLRIKVIGVPRGLFDQQSAEGGVV